jgi:hypothetical protein
MWHKISRKRDGDRHVSHAQQAAAKEIVSIHFCAQPKSQKIASIVQEEARLSVLDRLS